jgi:hypothetical protein
MGKVISAIREQLTSAEEEVAKQQKEQLEFLTVAGNAKLDKYQAALDASAYYFLFRSLLFSSYTLPHL